MSPADPTPRTVGQPEQVSNDQCTLFEQAVTRGLILGLSPPSTVGDAPRGDASVTKFASTSAANAGVEFDAELR